VRSFKYCSEILAQKPGEVKKRLTMDTFEDVENNRISTQRDNLNPRRNSQAAQPFFLSD